MSAAFYEARLQADLDEIRSRVAGVAAAVRMAVDESVRGLIKLDRDRLYKVMIRDGPINRDSRSIDALCHAFVARHLPAAGHLRFVSSVLRLNIALERIGDYAVTIARIGARLSRPLPATVCEEMRALSEQSLRMLELSTRAFLDADDELARETMDIERSIDVAHDRVFTKLVADELERPLLDQIGVLTVLHQIERVSDQAKNICEQAVFTSTGETKRPKRYRVLFVCASSALLGPLAEGLARKSFPESGRYASAGWAATEAFDPRLAGVVDRLSIDLVTAQPTQLVPFRPSPAEYHVVAAINAEWADLPEIPFQTAVLRWWIDPGDTDEALDAAARELSARIRDLMEALRGESAS